MRTLSILSLAGLLALSGCGGGDDARVSTSQKDDAARPTQQAAPAGATGQKRAPATATGTTITVRSSEFGPMLFDSRKQAIYIFENDRRGRTVCYGDCARAWPPVYTKGTPRARVGVNQSLLGTVTRRDGRQQVTYAGKPLYFYSHEKPGEVRCHNVNLNGGLWWVVGPDGKRRP